jgi:hypothetical protein
MTKVAEQIERMRADRWLAHQTIFERRHEQKSSPAHADLVRGIHGPEARLNIEGFRGFAKTTYLEEAAVLRACFGEFRYMAVVSANFRPLALQRMAAIKREFEINRVLRELFGDMRGTIWQEGQIVLKNGACIQAIGRDMSVTGLKWLDSRPDALLIDDVEDPDEMRSDVERLVTWDWLMKTMIPSLAHPMRSWVRSLGTRRGNGSLPERLEKAGWKTVKFPIEYQAETTIMHNGEPTFRRATWPGKFPLSTIDAMRWEYRGDMHTYSQEYMCQATSESARDFKEGSFRTVVRERRWEGVYAIYDPARTRGQQSATTGKAVASWVGRKLVVWQGSAHRWLPNEIVDDMFAVAAEFDPIWICVEENGLHEWLKTPIRDEQLRRAVSIPFKPLRAPKGQTAFIRGLQIYFEAGEVEFAGDCADLKAQLLSFPYPPIDAPNALAYMLHMRPGQPIYENFRDDHISLEVSLSPWRPLYLAGNARDGWSTAALVQVMDGQIHILADWAVEGPPEDAIASIATEARLIGSTMRPGRAAQPRGYDALKLPDTAPVYFRSPATWVVPLEHFNPWHNLGLVQAIGRLPATATRGGDEPEGRDYLHTALARMAHGDAAVQISERARWTLRALAGGYCRARNGTDAEPGPYRCLMEGIEALLGLIRLGVAEDDEEAAPNYAYDRQGRRYVSAMPARRN